MIPADLTYKSHLTRERREAILAEQDDDLVALCRADTGHSEWVCRVFLAQTGDMPPHRSTIDRVGWSQSADRVFEPFRSNPAEWDVAA